MFRCSFCLLLYQKGCNSKFTSGSELGGVDNFLVGSGDVGTFFLGTSSAAGAGGAGEASGAGDENFSSSPSLRSSPTLSGGVGDFCLGTSCTIGGSISCTTGGLTSFTTGGAGEASVTGDENFSSSSPSLRSSS